MENPKKGDPLGGKIYKVRMGSGDKGKGKSGGFRVITYLVEETKSNCEIFLIDMYDKSELSTVEVTAIKKLVKKMFPK